MKNYLAVDLGATSGRLMMAHVENKRLLIEEIYRFPTHNEKAGENWKWNSDFLTGEIINGMILCKEKGIIPDAIGIDCWGTDCVLLDADGRKITDLEELVEPEAIMQSMGAVQQCISSMEYYRRTGVRHMPINTIFKLMHAKQLRADEFQKGVRVCMLPSYINQRLTGIQENEYTNATTSGLINIAAKDWDYELIKRLGFPEDLFAPVSCPAAILGKLSPEIEKRVGFSCQVITTASHDTASAFLAVPVQDDTTAFISSGTWNLLGVLNEEPICMEEALQFGFSNEGAYPKPYKILKIFVGMYLVEALKREKAPESSYEELVVLAKKEHGFASCLDLGRLTLVTASNVAEAIKTECRESEQAVPQNLGQLLQTAFYSMAKGFQAAIEELQQILKRKITKIHVVGGGSQNTYLCDLTAQITGLPVSAGPKEAAVIGNVLCQMQAVGEIKNIEEAQKLVSESFAFQTYNA